MTLPEIKYWHLEYYVYFGILHISTNLQFNPLLDIGHFVLFGILLPQARYKHPQQRKPLGLETVNHQAPHHDNLW